MEISEMTLFLSFTLKFQTSHNIAFYLPVRRIGAFGEKKALAVTYTTPL